MRGFVTLERLRSVLDFDPSSGIFRWKVQIGPRAPAGTIAGSVKSPTNEGPYVSIKIDGYEYRAHRLAWFYVFEEWPTKQLDHKNRDARDNRICNLRIADPRQNSANRGPSSRSKSGLKGVSIRPGRTPRWVSTIQVDGVAKHLGTFDTADAAATAFDAAALDAYGEFAYQNF